MLPTRVSRSTYDTLKANCAAKITLQMTRLGLSPAQVMKASQDLILQFMSQTSQEDLAKLEHPASITMQDLYHYRAGMSLPKGRKLEALAKVLKCHPDDLVPKKYQDSRIVVERRGKASGVPEGKVNVVPMPTEPGYAMLQIEGVLPTEQCHKIAAMLVKHINFHTYKRGRPDLTDDQVREHFAQMGTPTP